MGKCILLAHTVLNKIRSDGDTLRMGEKWKLPWNMQRYVVNVSAVLSGQLFSFSFLKSIFLYCFSTSLFLVVNDKEEKEMWSCALRSAPFYPPPGNGGVMAILVLLTLQGQVIQLLDKAISVSALFQPHFPFSARISSDVKGMGLLPVFCSERDLFHMVNLTTAVWDFSPPTKHPWWLALGSLSCSNNNFWSF